MVEILRQHACGNDEFRRDALSKRIVLIGGGGKTQTSQVELRERIDLGSGVVFGIELAEQVREQRDVGQFAIRNVIEREVVGQIVDAMRGHFMDNTGQRRACLEVPIWLRRRLSDVGELEQRKRGERFGAVGLHLNAVKFLGLGHDSLELCGAERLLDGSKALCLLARLLGGGTTSTKARWSFSSTTSASNFSEVVGLELLAQHGERGFVAQRVYGRASRRAGRSAFTARITAR